MLVVLACVLLWLATAAEGCLGGRTPRHANIGSCFHSSFESISSSCHCRPLHPSSQGSPPSGVQGSTLRPLTPGVAETVPLFPFISYARHRAPSPAECLSCPQPTSALRSFSSYVEHASRVELWPLLKPSGARQSSAVGKRF